MEEIDNTLKALSENDDELRVANYIVLYGGRDLSAFRFLGNKAPVYRNEDGSAGEFFGKSVEVESSYTSIGRLPVDWEHGFLETDKDEVLGYVDWKTAKRDERGIFVERVLNRRLKYVQWLEELIKAGLVGTSSETIPGKAVKKENGEIVKWPLRRDTLTVAPMEPRMLQGNVLEAYNAIKSLFPPAEAVSEQGETSNTNSQENPIMDEKDIQAIVERAVAGAVTQTAEAVSKATAAVVDAKLDAFKSSLPEVKAGYHLEVIEDEADKAARENPFKSIGEYFMAVKNAAVSPMETDKRLLPFKAPLGANEAIPSQGGFLVPQQVAAGVFERMYRTGTLLSMVTRDPVQGNNLRINAVDETSRATGSRFGGLQGYWLEESGSITATKPRFSAIDLKLKKVAALAYATDEVLEDVNFMSSWLSRTVPEELRFLTEDAIYNGDGTGKPLGFMSSPALVSVTRIDANEVDFNDIVNMWARRWAGVNDYVWLINQDVTPQLDKLILGDGSTGIIPPRFVDYDAQGIMRIKGRPVIEMEYAATLGTAGDIVLFSPSQYQLIDKASGIQSAASIHVAFTTAEQAFRFIYRVDGAPLWKSALTPFKGSNTQTPYVALSASS